MKLLEFDQACEGMLKVIKDHHILSEGSAVDTDRTGVYLKSKILNILKNEVEMLQSHSAYVLRINDKAV